MESSQQLQHPQGTEGEHGHHHGGGGGGEDEHDHHEHGPKAVIKKVKQKAKKIKETLTKHGHSHEHHDKDDDNEEDEEDQQAHGAPRAAEAVAHSPPPYAAAPVAGFTHQGGGQQSTLPPLNEDLQAPKDRPLPSNYGSEVSVPAAAAGKEEEGMCSVDDLMDKMRVHPKQEFPPEESHDQSSAETTPERSYVSKMSSAVTDKATAAKNAVTSKLGYGGGEAGTDKSSNTSSVGDYGNKIASSEAGKVSGGGGGDSVGVAEEKRGVSVKEYLMEKLRPGEEDEMLSKVITNSMYKDEEKEEGGKKEKPMGKVTESEEVRKRLGMDKTDEEKEKNGGDGVSADSGAAGQAVVDRVKGWFGMGSPNSQPSSGTLLAGKKEEGNK